MGNGCHSSTPLMTGRIQGKTASGRGSLDDTLQEGVVGQRRQVGAVDEGGQGEAGGDTTGQGSGRRIGCRLLAANLLIDAGWPPLPWRHCRSPQDCVALRFRHGRRGDAARLGATAGDGAWWCKAMEGVESQ
jgi:hypothetical protein